MTLALVGAVRTTFDERLGVANQPVQLIQARGRSFEAAE